MSSESTHTLFNNEKSIIWIQVKTAIKLFLIFFLCVWLFGGLYFAVPRIFVNQWIYQSGHENPTMSYSDCFYFSAVTISTLWYGDLTPQGWMARGIVFLEVAFGLLFVWYSVSQVVWVRQEALIEYIAMGRIHEAYNICLDKIKDAKEIVRDERRSFEEWMPIDRIRFLYTKQNPFYPALQAINTVNWYNKHLEEIGKISDLSRLVERAAFHAEEMISAIARYIHIMENAHKSDWKTERTIEIISNLCNTIDSFTNNYIKYTSFANTAYKSGPSLYSEVISNTIKQLRKDVEI